MDHSNRSTEIKDSASVIPCPDRLPDGDLEFEIQQRIGQLARAAGGLTGGEPIARALTDLQRVLADCDVVPLDRAPALTPVDDLAGTAGAFRMDRSSLVDPFKIEKSKIGSQFDIVRAIVAASAGEAATETSRASVPGPNSAQRDPSAPGRPLSAMIDELKRHALRLADEAYRLGFVDGRDSR